MADKDSLSRFVFENFPVRGELVHLNASWQAMLERHEYPAPVRRLLGEAAAAAVLLASILKFKGQLTLQIHGTGPLTLLVAQCSADLHIRGMAKWADGDFPESLAGGRYLSNFFCRILPQEFVKFIPAGWCPV